MSRDVTDPAAALIGKLVDDLQPIRPMRFSSGLGFALAGLGVTLATVVQLFGVRPDVLAGRFDPMFLLASGLFLALGLAAATMVVVMSRPRVGNDHGGWLWAASTAALLPAAALIVGLGRGADAYSATAVDHGLDCLALGSGLAFLTFAVLVWWLRRGAPTSPERAGLLAGVAAGSFGIFAFSFHCPYNDIVHIGLWHSAVVVVSAAIGRVAVPQIIRW